MKFSIFCVAVLLLFSVVLGDIYMHAPRGSNNRLNGRGANRNNGNRVFDSQNNGAGGYCWGPPMTYYTGSSMNIEWTNQHSCGSDNAHCQVVIQVMCEDYIRDGNTTNTIPDNAGQYNTESSPGYFLYGMHEHYDYYQKCKQRSRNRGLFIANNNLGSQATRTRQNNGGTRRGFECPEERDYYPYWAPSPWIDLFVLTTDTSRCEYYKRESFNVKSRFICNQTLTGNERQPITELGCNDGSWMEVPPLKSRDGYGCIGEPTCMKAPWNRDNHLGNGIDGYPNMVNWTIPSCLEGKKCILRIRYNISTADYDPWTTDFTSNGRRSPTTNDPYVTVVANNTVTGNSDDPAETVTMRLAVNPDQFGRTFQDRSHVFFVEKLPSGVTCNKRIFNLNVKGKRGNIVQAYPAVEYDFSPSHLMVFVGDCIHIQWTGCDTNPNNFAGEGRAGTDRSNMVQIKSANDNYPWVWHEIPGGQKLFKSVRFAVLAALLGQTNCKTREAIDNNGNRDQDPQNCFLLNAAYPYFNYGILKVSDSGTYHYMSTRNNNFTNRSQKAAIVAVRPLRDFGIAIVSIGSAAFAVALVFAGLAAFAQCSPSSSLGEAAIFNAK